MSKSTLSETQPNLNKGSISELTKVNIRGLMPYEPHDYPDVIKLDANENPYPFPEEVRQQIYEAYNQVEFTRYPDPQSVELRKAIGEYAGVRWEETIVGNGGDEVLQMLMLAFTGEGDQVLIAPPTFSVYKIAATIAGAETLAVPLQPDYSLDVEQLLEKVTDPKVKVTILCTPNNPTGNLISQSVIEEVCQRAYGLVLVDEAYFEFGQATAVALLSKYENLIILRTFSKAFGLAGLRVGYLLANQEIIQVINRVKLAYNMNSFSQVAAQVVLANHHYFTPMIEEIIQERAVLSEALAQIPGITVFPSKANYVFVHVSGDGEAVHRQLVQEGILVRFLGSGLGVKDCLRITIGRKEENSLVVEKLKKILQG